MTAEPSVTFFWIRFPNGRVLHKASSSKMRVTNSSRGWLGRTLCCHMPFLPDDVAQGRSTNDLPVCYRARP